MFRVGLENEYIVREGDRPVNFRSLIHHLCLGERNLDPADRNAYRLASGAAVTADEGEAEIALPPMPIRPGFSRELEGRADQEYTWLARLLAPQLRLEGYSSHLSVGLPDRVVEPAARLYLCTFAPALMLLMDRRTSPGLLVRPRRRRLELCGEFVHGASLKAAAVFAAGSAIACKRALAGGLVGARLPDELTVSVARSVHRQGWYLDRQAFGPDLYSDGRAAILRMARGGSIWAQEHLEQCWQIAREALHDLVDDDDVAITSRFVAGELPLPSESAAAYAPARHESQSQPAFGSAIRPRERAHFGIAPVMLTWDLALYLVVGADGSTLFACVPAPYLGPFLAQLDCGRLDGVLEGYLQAGSVRRRLDHRKQTLIPGLFDAIGARQGLLDMERRNGREPRLDVSSALRRLWKSVAPPSAANALPNPGCASPGIGNAA